MEVVLKKTFVRDLQKLSKTLREPIEAFVFKQSVEAATIHDLGKIRKISGYSGYYRKRFGDYRAGFKMEAGKITFYRVLHRRDIYRNFP